MYDKINPFIYALLVTVGYVVGNVIIDRAFSWLEIALVVIASSVLFYVDFRSTSPAKP